MRAAGGGEPRLPEIHEGVPLAKLRRERPKPEPELEPQHDNTGEAEGAGADGAGGSVGSALAAPLAEELPDEVWALIASFIGTVQGLGGLGCTAKSYLLHCDGCCERRTIVPYFRLGPLPCKHRQLTTRPIA